MRVSLVLLLLLFAAARSAADTRRIAIAVGNNIGAGDRPPLRYAESDAAKVGRAFVELGGVDPKDLFLLQGRSGAALRDAMKITRERIRSWHQVPGTSVVVIFFYSGHSDGESLELGAGRLSFTELRAWLQSVGADMRVAIVDSCKSGALLAMKGGRAGPSFAIRLTDDVSSTGEALLTSSAADEVALESREIGGSFFTHHLVSGLRGAADRSRDGRVTLAEAYEYAFAHTVSATAQTIVGPQHPAYDYRVSGRGDLVLTDLTVRTSALDLPAGFDRILVQGEQGQEVLAEVSSRLARTRVAVPPGRYDVRAWNSGRLLVARVAVGHDQSIAVGADDFREAATVATAVKGGVPSTGRGVTLAIAGGVQPGVASTVGAQGTVAVGARAARPSGWSATAMVATARGTSFWETDAFATGGYRLGIERGRWRGDAGIEVGGGLIAQSRDAGSSLLTSALVAVPKLGTSLRVSPTVALALEGQFIVGWIRKDAANAALLLPGASLGILWSP